MCHPCDFASDTPMMVTLERGCRSLLTISSEVVIEDLEEGEGVPGVLRLFREDLVHVHSEQGPEQFTVFH